MSETIRLSKALKELNISIDAAYNYLENNNIYIEKNPNYKISSDIYKILINNFGKSESISEIDFFNDSYISINNLFSNSFNDTISKVFGIDNIKYITPKVKNTLAFNNFRRFPYFKKTEFNDITFLVGQNNSGKSTFVKAYMLIKSFLASGNIETLNFSYTGVEDLNIVTYNRAKCKSINAPVENAIDFTFNEDGIEYFIKVTANDKEVDAQVINFNIKDPKSGISLKFLPNILTFDFDAMNGEIYEDLQSNINIVNKELKQLQTNRANIKNQLSTDYINYNSNISKLKSKLNELRVQLKLSGKTASLTHNFKSSNFDSIVWSAIKEFKNDYAIFYKLSHSEELEKEKREYFEALQVFNENIRSLENIINDVNKNSNISKFKYLPASLNKQSSLFSIRDIQNPLAQVIHEYMQLKIYNSKDNADKFVKKWIQEDQLQIGEKIKIKLLEGEAYNFLVYSNKVEIPLADKGMGSIQAMLLILRIATIIHKQEYYGGEYTLVIEEPELNLHPALQSKLCEMFYEAFHKYGIKFIIETHSEYIIRKSQLIFKQNNFENNSNPFATIYFDKDITKDEFVWNMIYKEDGFFANNFGEGFFDATSNINLELFRLNRSK
ncbi:AAA family ATPase [Empedobacter tilapiae]